MYTHTNTHDMYIFNRTCQSLYIEVSSWMIRMESTAKHKRDALSVRHRASLFINGLLSAYKITHYVKTMMNYHSHMRKPMTKSTLLHLCKLLELLKVVTIMYDIVLLYMWSLSIVSAVYIPSLFTQHHKLYLLHHTDLSGGHHFNCRDRNSMFIVTYSSLTMLQIPFW